MKIHISGGEILATCVSRYHVYGLATPGAIFLYFKFTFIWFLLTSPLCGILSKKVARVVTRVGTRR